MKPALSTRMRKIALKSFRKPARQERALTLADVQELTQGKTFPSLDRTIVIKDKKEHRIRKQSDFSNTYGLGEAVAPGILFFKKGSYGMTKVELDRTIGNAQRGSEV